MFWLGSRTLAYETTVASLEVKKASVASSQDTLKLSLDTVYDLYLGSHSL